MKLISLNLWTLCALIGQIESWLTALAYFNSIAFNAGLKEFINLWNHASFLALTFGVKEVSKVSIMQKLIAILCWFLPGTRLLIFKHCGNTKFSQSWYRSSLALKLKKFFHRRCFCHGFNHTVWRWEAHISKRKTKNRIIIEMIAIVNAHHRNV